MKRFILLLALLLSVLHSESQTVYQPDWKSLDARPTSQWWLDAKFGIFIHWGVYSVPAYTEKGRYAEWYLHSLTNDKPDGPIVSYHRTNYGSRTYYDLADDFHAELYNPDEWAQLFEKAGARYVVLTSKHHDGFCLWPNQQANRIWGRPWNAVDCGPRRDLLGELFVSLRKTQVRPGLYYSLYEWYNPLWQFDKQRYAHDHAMPQLVDVVTRYKPDVVWADGDWDATPEVWQSPQFLAWLYNESPVRSEVVVNDRWGSGVRFNHAGIYTPEYQPDIDFENHAWEESRGMGYSYGYNRREDAWDYNSSQTLILHLIDKVSRGGNFLLDIGPDGHGQIPPIMQERLLDIGRWLSINGEAIYSTRRWRSSCQWSAGRQDYQPKKEEGWKTGGDILLKQTIDPDSGYAVKELFFTWNPVTKNLYAIFPKWPADRRIALKDIQLPNTTEVTLLEGNQRLRFDVSNGQTYVYLPEYVPSRFKAPQAYVIRIAGFGAFSDKPELLLNYAPQNMQPIVSMRCSTPGAVIRYALGDEPLNAQSKTYTQPFTLDKDTKVRARAFAQGMLPSHEVNMDVKTVPYMPSLSMYRQPDAGLRVELLQADTFSSSGLERGRLERTYHSGSIALDSSCQSSKCGMIWKGYLYADQTGGYKFSTESDDGSLLYLDGALIVHNDGDHGMQERTGYAYLQQGFHAIKIVYFNSGGAAGLKVKYGKVPEEQLTEIPAAMLGH